MRMFQGEYTMDPNELEQAWNELQEVPAYFERFDKHAMVRLIVVQYCYACGVWHDADEGCPQVVAEVA